MKKFKGFVCAAMLFVLIMIVWYASATSKQILPQNARWVDIFNAVTLMFFIYQLPSKMYDWVTKDKVEKDSIAVSDVTYTQIYLQFLNTTKIDKTLINDYRPCAPTYNVPIIPMSIVVWMTNGSRIIYTYSFRQELGENPRN